jgi:hypothetical protein
MVWTIFVLLLVLWALGWGFHVAGGLVHVLLLAALVLLVVNLVARGRSPA